MTKEMTFKKQTFIIVQLQKPKIQFTYIFELDKIYERA